MQNLDKIFTKLKNSEISAVSEFRDESKQKVVTRSTIPMFKLAPNKKFKLLFLKEVALDFNPFDIHDDSYSVLRKFRPELSVENAIEVYKKAIYECENPQEAIDYIEGRVGVSLKDWNTDKLSKEEMASLNKEIFNMFMTPMIYSVPAFHIKFSDVTSSVFGADYKLELIYDENTGLPTGYIDHKGEQIDGKPIPMKLAELMKSLAFEEVKKLKEQIARKEIIMDSKVESEKVRSIFDKRQHITEVKPKNFYLAIEIPMTPENEIDKASFNVNDMDVAGLKKHLRIVRMTKKYSTAIEEIRTDATEEDTNLNFYEFLVSVPDAQRPTDMARDMTLNSSRKKLDKEMCDKLNALINELVVPETGLEKSAVQSFYIRTYNSAVESTLLSKFSTPEVFNPEDEFLTDEVFNAHRDIIELILGKNGIRKLAMKARRGDLNPSLVGEEDKKSLETEKDLAFLMNDDNDDFDLEEDDEVL